MRWERPTATGLVIVALSCAPSIRPSTENSTGSSTTAASTTGADGASEVGVLPDSSGSTTSMDGTGAETSTPGTESTGAPPTTDECPGWVDQCNDGVDNDRDGLTDMADPECLSPCHLSESELGSPHVGDTMDCRVDCAFDGNFGKGDDGCSHDLRCDPEGPGALFSCEPAPVRCPPGSSEQCQASCLPRVPNGCDCYGCCAFEVGGEPTFLYVGVESICDLEALDRCGLCTPDLTCFDECTEPCEVCVGSTTPPDGCQQAYCDDGELPCTIEDDGQHDCPDGFFCLTGCCHPDP